MPEIVPPLTPRVATLSASASPTAPLTLKPLTPGGVRAALAAALIVAVALLGIPATAQGNLYGPGTPDNASYVRVVHAVAGAPEATALIGGGLSGDTLAFGEASDYALALEGETPITVEVGEAVLELTFTVAPSSFYTVALVGSPEAPELQLLEDEVSDNLARTLLALYNFTEAPLSLKTADGETEVVASVAPLAADGVMVNPVTVSLGVFADGERLHTLDDVQLEAGEAYSVFVFGPLSDEGAVSLVRAASRD